MDFNKMFPMKLGFGGLRLPTNGEKDDINYKKMCEMVDEYVSNGGKYFDTSFIYHKGASENAMGACVVDRLPRESFCLADKMPLWAVGGKTDLAGVFNTQLNKCHTDYFDFYLLHNVNRNAIKFMYDANVFEFQQKIKSEGKIRFAGMSFHDKPELLDELLTKHEYFDFVQLQINYYDWLSNYVQAKKCYEVATAHNKPVVVMETVRGGALANLPDEAGVLMKEVLPDMSEVSLAVRFAASLDNVFMVLSGMTTLEQVKDNCSYMRAESFRKLSDAEYELTEQIRNIIRGQRKYACSECGACNDVCHAGIDICKAISIYNDGEMFGGLNFPDMHYNIHIKEHATKKCMKCGSCQTVCPNSLPVIDILQNISAAYD